MRDADGIRTAPNGSQPMPSRTRCPRCETVLNVPIGAEGRKLKCPRCTTTFRVGDPGSEARTSMPGMDTARPSSSSPGDLPRRKAGPAPPPRQEEPDLPFVAGDLRDQFDLPLLGEDEGRPAPRPPSGPSSGGIPVPVGPSPYAEADAAGLIEDDEPARPRRLAAAEARARARRCGCGGVVPAGMSLCPRCGLDQETGTRDATFDVLEVEAPLPRAPSSPFGVMVVGVTSALVGAGLMLMAMVLYVLQSEAPYRWGFLLLAAVSAFGVYAAIRLLRHRSPRLLLIALMLGGMIDVAALIILPIAIASTAPPVAIKHEDAGPDGDGDRQRPAPIAPPAGDAVLLDAHGVPRIVPLTERIDWDKVNLGLAILGVTSVVAIYLNSGQVRRYASRP